jgi:hypothetical protein
MDNFDHFYAGKKNKVCMFNREGTVLNEYIDERRDSLQIIEFRNPFKMVILALQHQEIIYLDHTLGKIDEFKVSEMLGTSEEIKICGSHLSGFYIYDSFNRDLIKLNHIFKEEYRRTVNFGEYVNTIADFGESLIISYKSGDIAIYDVINDQLRRIDFTMTGSIHQTTGQFYFYHREKRRLEFYDHELKLSTSICLPDEIDIKDAVYFKGKILFFDKDRIYISKAVIDQ